MPSLSVKSRISSIDQQLNLSKQKRNVSCKFGKRFRGSKIQKKHSLDKTVLYNIVCQALKDHHAIDRSAQSVTSDKKVRLSKRSPTTMNIDLKFPVDCRFQDDLKREIAEKYFRLVGSNVLKNGDSIQEGQVLALQQMTLKPRDQASTEKYHCNAQYYISAHSKGTKFLLSVASRIYKLSDKLVDHFNLRQPTDLDDLIIEVSFTNQKGSLIFNDMVKRFA
jgi:hypothetical protein